LHIDTALGRAGDGQQVASVSASVELCGEVARREKGRAWRWILDQGATDGRGIHRAEVGR